MEKKSKTKARKKATPGVKSRKAPQQKIPMAKFQITAPEANRVTIAGDFNSWNPDANPLQRDENGVWKVDLPLQPGSYQYKFLIDGREWREDPDNPSRVATPFGTFNSVREVG